MKKRTRYSQFFFADPLLAAPLHIILFYRRKSNNFSLSPQGAGDKNCTPCQSQFIMSDDDPPPTSSPYICQRRGEGERKRVSEKFCPHATTLPSMAHYGCAHCRCHFSKQHVNWRRIGYFIMKKNSRPGKTASCTFWPIFYFNKKALSHHHHIGYVWFFSYHHLRPEIKSGTEACKIRFFFLSSTSSFFDGRTGLELILSLLPFSHLFWGKSLAFSPLFLFLLFLLNTRTNLFFLDARTLCAHIDYTCNYTKCPSAKNPSMHLGIPPNASKEGEKETGPNGKFFPSFPSFSFFFRTHENFFPLFVRPNGGWRRGWPLGRTKAMRRSLSLFFSFLLLES